MSARAVLLALLWLSLVGVGAARCYRFETSAGPEAPAPVTWPLGTTLTRSHAGPTLVMFAHPECACTAASLAEIAVLLAEIAVRPRVMIVFTGAQDPRASANWQRAGAILGALRLHDDHGEARRFGALTSGHALVYDRGGELRFAGGITGSRGHAGDNMGRRAVLAALAGQPAEATHGVFGCSLGAEP